VVPFPPVEPSPTEVRFPDVRGLRGREVIAMGADFRPGTILAAYRRGIFPWPNDERDPRTGDPLVFWHSPDPRAVFPIDREPAWSRSLTRTLRRHPYFVTVDQAFADVVEACRDERPDAVWIVPEYISAYVELHRMGWAHSVEVWAEREAAARTRRTRELVGGIYGIAMGGVFSGESMFHRRTDCSKIAFAFLAMRLRACGFSLFDVQVMNPHLASLGCVSLARADFLRILEESGNRPVALA
jgi:leucyl/phenylalanyl-tRNA--protein transferase